MNQSRSLSFRKDGTFRVLQLADVQDGPNVSSDAIALISQAIERADPDLVVLTGDQIRGYDPAYTQTFISRHGNAYGDHIGLGVRVEQLLSQRSRPCADPVDPAADIDSKLENTRGKVRSTLRQFLDPIVSHHIPFAVTYGNHDFQCGIPVEEQDDMYREFDGCINPSVSEHTGASGPSCVSPACEPGTFSIDISSSRSSSAAMSIVMVNSGDFEPGGGYGAPSANAIEWLGRSVGHEQKDGAAIPSIVFQHIPPEEFYQCLKRVSPFTPHAVEGYRRFSDSCYVINREVCRPGSVLGEGPCCSERNVGEVSALRNAGNCFALYCGHDHKNSFVGHVDGIDLGYAPTCGFCSYGPKARERALRLFVFQEDSPESYETRLLTYGDLVGRRAHDPIRLLAGEYMVSDASGMRNLLRHPAIGVGALAVASKAVIMLAKDMMGRQVNVKEH
ncbi:MAG: metallophosphoesterase family protein [Bifidobacterium sp.]|uniref:Metallophosphoesterase family protein n=1 Tax=Bifidobacterium fermentum TaxID=3059035 RepID=A0AB39UNJ7_9BIFI